MTYVYLDPDGLQNLINGLKAYADTILSNKEAVSGSNAFHCYPADLMNFDAKLGAAQSALEDESKDLQVRLDSAKAANDLTWLIVGWLGCWGLVVVGIVGGCVGWGAH